MSNNRRETPCKLCGMSFNIGRVRKPDEPYEAAWNPECGEPGQFLAGDYKNFISMDDEKGPRCPESAGCRDVRRETSDKHPDCVEIDGDDGETDDSDDEYIYESEQDESDSSYTEGEEELDEENEKSDCMPTYGWKKHSSASQGRNVRSCRLKGKDNQNTAYSSVTRDELRAMIDFVKIAQPCKPTAEAATQSASPKSNEDSELDEEFYKLGRDNGELEHLAGPDCGPLYGYSGCRITSEEMKGCTTVQWLVYKTPEWDVEFDDQIFELRSQYFLTGLSGRMPSSDDDGSEFVPVRHGADTLYPDTVSFGDHPLEAETPMPFHPTCFEIFTRASRLLSHHIDIHGLAGWRRLESSYRAERDFPRHNAVKQCAYEWWYHEPGYEWLAANPVLVPLLPSLLCSAAHEEHTPLEEAYLSSNDPFKKLPLEMKDAILDLLPPTDIASLRLASCATHLPISHWRELLWKEMPWLWEIWDDVAPSTWATISVPALAAKQKEYENMEALLKERHAIIKEEMPEILDLWSHRHGTTVDKSYASVAGWSEIGDPITPQLVWHTNWCLLYYLIGSRWADLKGLQNRQRIWEDIQEILSRIERYREEGSIV